MGWLCQTGMDLDRMDLDRRFVKVADADRSGDARIDG